MAAGGPKVHNVCTDVLVILETLTRKCRDVVVMVKLDDEALVVIVNIELYQHVTVDHVTRSGGLTAF